jgi:signal transduction histidine kinase
MAKYEPESTKEVDSQEVAETILRMSASYRDPFISIIGYSEALLEGLSGKLTEAQRTDVEAIRISGWEALGQLNDILDVMLLLAKEIEYNHTLLDVGQLLQDVGRDVERSRSESTLPVKIKVEDNLPRIKGDELRLRQTLLGLVIAAIQNTPTELAVHLMAKKHDDGVLIEILDGCQVANEDDLAYFFEPCWLSRLKDKSWRRMQWQSYLAHYFVNAHKGKIWVENVEASDGNLPAGTRVSIVMPAAKEEKETAKDQEAEKKKDTAEKKESPGKEEKPTSENT